MTLGERVKLVRNGMSQKEFGAKFNIAINTLRRYEAGTNPPDADFLLMLCNDYSLNPAWLLAGEGPIHKGEEDATVKECPPIREKTEPPQPQSCYVDDNGQTIIPRWQNPDPEMFDYVPMVETQLSAGGGCFVISEEIEGYYAFRKSWLSRVATSTKNLVLMRVLGDSMSPTIQEHDAVMIDIGKRGVKEGMIYAICADSTLMIKRLVFRPGGRLKVISDNRKEFEAYETDSKDLHIIGQVIFSCRVFPSI